MDQYAVFGNPIAQSKSPIIHQQFAHQVGHQLDYTAILASEEGFKSAVHLFVSQGGQGCNVTAPFKHQAFEMADELSEHARIAGAVNTLSFDDGKIVGDNTDGRGLIADFEFANVGIQDKRVLLIGAGGAARGVLLPLLDQKPAKLIIVNRTVEKAQALAALCKTKKIKVCGVGFDDLADKPFDIIINASSAGLSKQIPPLKSSVLAATTICYDMVYGAGNTTFNQWALDHGVVKVIDGLGMLVEQAAISFEIWRGVKPDTKTIRELLRQQLS